MSNTTVLNQLHQMAVQSRQNSHSPYSHQKVGAAIRTHQGDHFGGCNVENASYGGTVCAERIAVFKGISEKGAFQISDVVVVTDHQEAWPPCGFCRQVIAEFASAQTMIHIGNLQGIQRSLKFAELFPESFTPAHLK